MSKQLAFPEFDMFDESRRRRRQARAFDAIAAGSLTNLFATENPRPVKCREDVLEMLEAAY